MIFISIFNKSKLTKAYFEEIKPPYKIKYVEEKNH